MRGRGVLVLSAIVVFWRPRASAQAQSAAAAVRGRSRRRLRAVSDDRSAAGTRTLRIVGAQDTVPRVSVRPSANSSWSAAAPRRACRSARQYFIRRAYCVRATPSKTAAAHDSRPPAGSGSSPSTTRRRSRRSSMTCDGVFAGDYLEPFVAPVAIARRARRAVLDARFLVARRA